MISWPQWWCHHWHTLIHSTQILTQRTVTRQDSDTGQNEIQRATLHVSQMKRSVSEREDTQQKFQIRIRSSYQVKDSLKYRRTKGALKSPTRANIKIYRKIWFFFPQLATMRLKFIPHGWRENMLQIDPPWLQNILKLICLNSLK